jgi:glycerate-2-kinase
MIIKNRAELATTLARAQALDIIEAGIARVLPENVMRSALSVDAANRRLTVSGQSFDLTGRVFVVGGGKASAAMARTLEEILGADAITAGIVTTKHGDEGPFPRKIAVVPAAHPVPDQIGVDAVNRMLALKAGYSIGRGDMVICLLSGGGSALLPAPADGISLADKQRVTELLVASGADIGEINVVRKHLSKTKGGRLGRFFAPATVVSLVLSDAIGDDLSVIASGPTYPDPSTHAGALAVLRKYGLVKRVPGPVIALLEKGAQGRLEENPRTLDNCRNFIIGNNSLALAAMADQAAGLGLRPIVVTAAQRGDTTEAAAQRASEIIAGKYTGHNVILLGGETTPTLPSHAGKGGRNQHFAAASLLAMREYPRHWLVASIGTDGSDFLPDVAGAIVDKDTMERLIRKSIDVQSHVDRFDSYNLLEMAGNALVRAGATGTNVGDVIVYVVE